MFKLTKERLVTEDILIDNIHINLLDKTISIPNILKTNGLRLSHDYLSMKISDEDILIISNMVEKYVLIDNDPFLDSNLISISKKSNIEDEYVDISNSIKSKITQQKDLELNIEDKL